MNTLSLFTLLLAIATFLLATAAFWAIWQNYSVRKEDRELNLKTQALNEINEWANNLLQAVMITSAVEESLKLELKQRLMRALSVEVYIINLAKIFSGELEKKVDTAEKAVSKLQKTLFSIPSVAGEGYFSPQNEEHKALVGESISSLDDLLEAVCKAKIDLFVKREKAIKSKKD